MKTNTEVYQIERANLDRNRTRHWRRWPAGTEIVLLEGKLWLTFESDPNDYFLEAGQSLYFPEVKRNVVVQSLEPTAFVKVLSDRPVSTSSKMTTWFWPKLSISSASEAKILRR